MNPLRHRIQRARIPLKALLVLLTTLAPLGCSAHPPRPWPTVNACVDKHRPLYRPTQASGDTRPLVRCRSCDKFGESRHGHWIYTWLVARFDVLSAEKGNWSEPELSFICFDAWPTPESGIMVGKAVWPYRPGVELRFEIDTTTHPPTVVSQHFVSEPPPQSAPAGEGEPPGDPFCP